MWYEWLRETTWGCSMLRELYSGTHVTVKTEDFRKKLASVGFRQDLLHSFDLPVELSIPTAYWTAFCRASDFSIDMGEILEELNAQGISKPLSHVDMGKTLDSFDFPTPVIDLILEFYEPMSPGEIAEELFQQRNLWKAHRRTFSDDYDFNIHSRFGRFSRDMLSCKDYWTKEPRCNFIQMGEIILGDASECVQMERYRIGFLEITRISDKDDALYLKEGWAEINYEKILVLYDTRVNYDVHWKRRHGELEWSAHAFQPPQWNEYISKSGAQRYARIKFTSGPTIREAIRQNVQNDVKFVISDMAKELISFLQVNCKLWVGELFSEFDEDDVFLGGKHWLFSNGGLKAMSTNLHGAEDPLRENDGVTYTYYYDWKDPKFNNENPEMYTKVPDFDPIKTARKNKWERTKANSNRKRRRKYEKENNFRRKRVHSKIQAWKSLT